MPNNCLGEDIGRISSTQFQFKALTKATKISDDNQFHAENIDVV